MSARDGCCCQGSESTYVAQGKLADLCAVWVTGLRHYTRSKASKTASIGQLEGAAALGICESLLLALSDLEIINERDVRDLLTDVVNDKEEAAGASQTPEKHQAVVAIVQRSLAGKDGMRSH